MERKKQTREERNAKVREWRKKNIEDQRSKQRERYHRNKEQRAAYIKQWKKDNPEKQAGYEAKWAAKETKAQKRNRHLKQKYGITHEEYQAMVDERNNCCDICKQQPRDGRYLVVDHCHKTGKIRGLLCDACNTGIGLLGDNPKELLLRMKRFLAKYKRVGPVEDNNWELRT